MNRANRRHNPMNKANEMMNSNVTITEAVQISRGVAQDVVQDYHRRQGNVQLSLTMQVEILRNIIISAGLTTEDKFKEMYMQKAQELQEMQNKMLDKEEHPTMSVSAGDIEIKSES